MGHFALSKVSEVLACQWLSSKTFRVLKNLDVDPILALLAIVHGAQMDLDAKLDLDRLSCTFDERMISVPRASVLLRRVSVSGEWVEDGGTHIKIREYREIFANWKTSKAYERKEEKPCSDTSEELTDLLQHWTNKTHLWEEQEEIVLAEPAAEAVPAVDDDSLLAGNVKDL